MPHLTAACPWPALPTSSSPLSPDEPPQAASAMSGMVAAAASAARTFAIHSHPPRPSPRARAQPSAIHTLLTSVYRSIASLAHLAAPAAGLDPAPGRGGVERVGHVHPDVPGANGAGQTVRASDVAGPDRRRRGRSRSRSRARRPRPSSSNGSTQMTGPKISSRAIRMSSSTPVNTAGREEGSAGQVAVGALAAAERAGAPSSTPAWM